jgi:hypothetical protein
MNECMCVCRSGHLDVAHWPTHEDRARWLQEYQRDLEQQAEDVAEEIKGLQEGPQSADQPPEFRAVRARSGLPSTCGCESRYGLA